MTANADKFLAVTPMKPKSHALDVDWFVETIEERRRRCPSRSSATTGARLRDRIREALLDPSGGTRGRIPSAPRL